MLLNDSEGLAATSCLLGGISQDDGNHGVRRKWKIIERGSKQARVSELGCVGKQKPILGGDDVYNLSISLFSSTKKVKVDLSANMDPKTMVSTDKVLKDLLNSLQMGSTIAFEHVDSQQ